VRTDTHDSGLARLPSALVLSFMCLLVSGNLTINLACRTVSSDDLYIEQRDSDANCFVPDVFIQELPDTPHRPKVKRGDIDL
jgi:hypothetical protein